MKGDVAAIDRAKTTLEDTWAEVDAIKKDVDNAVSEVGSFWTGSASALYVEVHKEYETNTSNLMKALQELAGMLGDVALQSRADIVESEDVITDLREMMNQTVQ